MWLELYHNDQYVNTAFGQAPNTWADAGNSAILELHVGDKLSIRAKQGENVILFGEPDQVYSTFSAALLSPTLHAAPTTATGTSLCYINTTGKQLYAVIVLDLTIMMQPL